MQSFDTIQYPCRSSAAADQEYRKMSKKGPTDFEMISADDYYKLDGQHHSLDELHRLARSRGMCEVCGSLPIWRLAGTGMCFVCTTGESDASDDYELIQE